jgi:hypothetical protein
VEKPSKGMRTQHTSHDIIALHKIQKSYYLYLTRTAVARRFGESWKEPGE